MILLIDNYDSFTYNLYQFIGIFNNDIKVVRNDKITIEEIEALDPESIVISPGPKSPLEAGISVEVIKHFTGKKPILGICLFVLFYCLVNDIIWKKIITIRVSKKPVSNELLIVRWLSLSFLVSF